METETLAEVWDRLRSEWERLSRKYDEKPLASLGDDCSQDLHEMSTLLSEMRGITKCMKIITEMKEEATK